MAFWWWFKSSYLPLNFSRIIRYVKVRKSLSDFLSFYKENPEENFVYVLQHPPANINILGASDFGYLVICLPNYGPDSQIIFSSSPFGVSIN